MAVLGTVKSIVSQASLEIGIVQQPVSAVMGSRDQDVAQMAALLYAVAAEVLMEEPYRTTLGDEVWIADGNGDLKLFFTADTDRILFDARLAVDGLKYRFLQAKGWEFAEPLRDFTTRLNKLAGRVNARVLDLDADAGRVI